MCLYAFPNHDNFFQVIFDLLNHHVIIELSYSNSMFNNVNVNKNAPSHITSFFYFYNVDGLPIPKNEKKNKLSSQYLSLVT